MNFIVLISIFNQTLHFIVLPKFFRSFFQEDFINVSFWFQHRKKILNTDQTNNFRSLIDYTQNSKFFNFRL